MQDSTSLSEAKQRACVVCGQSFTPNRDVDVCCSPFCRAMQKHSSMEQQRKAAEAATRERLDALKKPPSFNLKENPRALAEWFMELPPEYKARFSRFLSDKDREFARDINQKRMSEERYLSGFFVKKGKIVEVKSAASDETETNEQPDTQDNDGTEAEPD